MTRGVLSCPLILQICGGYIATESDQLKEHIALYSIGAVGCIDGDDVGGVGCASVAYAFSIGGYVGRGAADNQAGFEVVVLLLVRD